jgi:hypothetical protein
MALDAGSRWRGFCCDGCQLVAFEGFSDALGGGGSDALVDRECLPQVFRGPAGYAVVEVALADSFQGACFVKGNAPRYANWNTRRGYTGNSAHRRLATDSDNSTAVRHAISAYAS